MAEGTVRGAFDLDTGPATRAVADYRREAARADVQTKQLGATIDRSFSRKQVEQIKTVGRATTDLSRDTHRARMEVRQEWQGMRRDVQREAAQIVSTIAVVRDRMRALGRERAVPSIDLDGIAKALSQIELLQARLSTLGATRVTPSVGVGGGFGSAAARAASGAAAGGGDAGGRGGSGLLSMGGVGFSGVRGRTLLAGAGLALPALQAVGGAAVGLGGSAGAAALGGGAVGLGGLAPLVAGIGAVMSVVKPANESLKEVAKTQEAFSKAVREHGRDSKQAAEAEKELTRARRIAGPGAGYAAAQERGFGADWRRASAPARQQWFGLRGDVAQVGRRVAPQLAANALSATSAVRQSGTRFARFGAGGAVQDNLGVLTRQFSRELPTVERTLENVTLTMMRLARASLPFFHEANVWVEQWTHGWRASTADISGTRDKMRPLVESAKDWTRLTGATFRLLRDIFRMGRPSGDSMVESLTVTFDRWDEWIKTHPEQVRDFFEDTSTSVREMARGLSGVVHWLNEMATTLRPLLDRFSQLLAIVTKLGLIGTPGAIAGLMGAWRGFRGAGGAGAGVAALAMGGGVMGGRGARGAGAGVGGLGAAGAVAAAGAYPNYRQMMATRRSGATPAGARTNWTGWAPGAQAVGTAAGARGALGAAGARGLGALRGAGRAYAPIALGLGALDFASTEGTLAERLQASVSSMSLGIIPRGQTGAEAGAQGVQQAQTYTQRLGSARSPRELHAQIAQVQRQRAKALAGSRVSPDRGLFGGAGLLGLAEPGRMGTEGPTAKEAKRNAAAAAEYARTLRDLRQQEDALNRSRKRQLDTTSKQRAREYGYELPKAFSTYREAGQSRKQAGASTAEQIEDRLKRTRNAGVETLGEASLQWARALAKRYPEMRDTVDKLTESIHERFRKMGRRVRIVNGNILTGTKSEWQGISRAMSGATEQARQKTQADFTAIQRQAIGALTAMGYSRSDARDLVGSMEKGGAAGKTAAADAASGPTGAGQRPSESARNNARSHGLARGGTIGGRGLLDTVPTPDGGKAAPGETWIANRHTMNALSSATVDKYGKTAEQMIRGEQRLHAMPMIAPRGGIMPGYARGGRTGVGSRMARMVARANAIDREHYPYVWGGGHDAGFKPPYDCSGAVSAVLHAGGYMSAPATSGALANMFEEGPGAVSIYANPTHTYMSLAGRFFGTSTSNPSGGAGWFDGAPRRGFSVRHVGGAAGLAGGPGGLEGLGGDAAASIALRAPRVRQRGAPGAARARAGAMYAAGLQGGINRALAAGAGAGAGGGAAGGTLTRAQVLRIAGQALARTRAFPNTPENRAALANRAQQESGYNAGITQGVHDVNSGGNEAVGLMQMIPGTFGSYRDKRLPNDRRNPLSSMVASVRYMKGRYGHVVGATGQGYARGGQVKWAGAFDRGGSFTTDGPTAFMAGEGPRNRRERVTVRPEGAGAGVTVNVGGITVNVKGGGGNAEGLAEEVGRVVVGKIIEALDRAPAGLVG